MPSTTSPTTATASTARPGRWTALCAGLLVPLLATAAVPLLVSSGPLSSTAQAGYRPGSSGVGDAYFPRDGNGGYGARSYDLALRWSPATGHLDGVATIRARAHQPLSRFDLDLHGLQVHSVLVDGRQAAFHRDGPELVVDPAGRGIAAGTDFVVEVRYGGVPRPVRDGRRVTGGLLRTPDGAVAGGAPHPASGWFPVNDHPSDRARYTVAVTVPAALQVVANGHLTRWKPAADVAWSTWTYRAREPMAAYLTVLDIGVLSADRHRSGGHFFTDVLPAGLDGRAEEVARASLARQPQMIRFLERRLGRYPFRDAGTIVASGRRHLPAVLGTQTRAVVRPGAFTDRRHGEAAVVRGLAHQWFGADVGLRRWRHVWLAEGMAEYAGWLWDARRGGPSPQQRFTRLLRTPAGSPFWDLRVDDPGPRRLFSAPVRLRGAMALQALRRQVGDRDFFATWRRWSADRGGRPATTVAFVRLAHRVSGERVRPLLHTWLGTARRPAGGSRVLLDR